jgi:hypothetical protein
MFGQRPSALIGILDPVCAWAFDDAAADHLARLEQQQIEKFNTRRGR